MVTTVTGTSDDRVQTNALPPHAESLSVSREQIREPIVTVSISGEPLRVAPVPDTDFRPIQLDTANEYRAALKVLSEASELTQKVADRLTDPLDGKTTEGIRRLIGCYPDVSPRFLESIRGYLYGVLSSGGTLDPSTGAVIIPPLSREEFTTAIAACASFQEVPFDTAGWIDHLYDPRPNIGQGYYRFKSPADWERFIELVSERVPETGAAISRLRELFDQATVQGTIAPANHSEYVQLSQTLLSAQETVLEALLEKVPGAFDPLTRVTIELRPGLNPDIVVVPYSAEFKAELTRISGNLLTAENLLPPEAVILREMVLRQEQWCLAPSTTRGWGEPNERWIDVPSEAVAFDIQFHCAETVSLSGDKRNFQLLITQPLSDRELAALDISPPSSSFSPGYGAPQTSTPYVRLLDSGGVARYPVTSREDAIEPISSPESDAIEPSLSMEIQKQPILVNVVSLGIMHDTGSMREIHPTLVDDLARASIVAEALKMANRPDSATQYILGVPGELTANGYAVAGAVGNAVLCRPDTIRPVLDVLVGYDALVCLRGGGYGAIERSTLGIVQELERRGAISLDVSSGGLRITHIDPVKLREIARTLQHQLQLWQLGLPLAAQRRIIESIEYLPPEQSLAPTGLVFARTLDQVTRRRMRDEARQEVEAFFARDAVAPLIEKLTPLLDTVPMERMVVAPPTDREVNVLFSELPTSPFHE